MRTKNNIQEEKTYKGGWKTDTVYIHLNAQKTSQTRIKPYILSTWSQNPTREACPDLQSDMKSLPFQKQNSNIIILEQKSKH